MPIAAGDGGSEEFVRGFTGFSAGPGKGCGVPTAGSVGGAGTAAGEDATGSTRTAAGLASVGGCPGAGMGGSSSPGTTGFVAGSSGALAWAVGGSWLEAAGVNRVRRTALSSPSGVAGSTERVEAPAGLIDGVSGFGSVFSSPASAEPIAGSGVPRGIALGSTGGGGAGLGVTGRTGTAGGGALPGSAEGGTTSGVEGGLEPAPGMGTSGSGGLLGFT